MRVDPLSSGARVRVSRAEVADFASRWPGFGPPRALGFELASNGDLVDVHGLHADHSELGVAVLLQDARDAARRAGAVR